MLIVKIVVLAISVPIVRVHIEVFKCDMKTSIVVLKHLNLSIISNLLNLPWMLLRINDSTFA